MTSFLTQLSKHIDLVMVGWFMVFNNISTISWRSILLVEETGIPGENHRPVASHWRTLSHNVVSSTTRHEQGSNSKAVVKPTIIRSRPQRHPYRLGHLPMQQRPIIPNVVSLSPFLGDVLDKLLCDRVCCNWLAGGWCFYLGATVSSTI